MARWAWLAAAVMAGLALAWFSASTPAPLSADAPPLVFSAGRAMADIRIVAKAPHPTGSPENAAVRDYLVARLGAMGLSPRVQRAASEGGTVENVLAMLPGRDHAKPALALMAHYDSAPSSPGAADDATGVAAVLETVRALKAAGSPVRDVVLVLTDGEEPGLLGARAFFGQDPLAKHIGLAINLEARGGAGRAMMFETGADNGGLIDLLRRNAALPFSNSLAVFLYKLLPNDTDFTVAKASGVTGFNFAFIGRQIDYHAPSSTPEALDQGAVQSTGDQALAIAQAVAFANDLPAPQPDVVYSHVFGDLVLAYPSWGGWLLLAATAALLIVAALASRRRAPFRGLDLARGAVAPLVIIVLAALLLYAARHATGIGFGFPAQRPLLARIELWELTLALIDGLAIMIAAKLLGAGGGARTAATWLGMLITGFVVAVVLQIAHPLVALLFSWPMAAAALAAAM
ncbi:MAG: M20/M25/M40 family metallo-hydrolase, partial [Caulobacteraceae bacterium]